VTIRPPRHASVHPRRFVLLPATHEPFPLAEQAGFGFEDHGGLGSVVPVQVLDTGVDGRGLAALVVADLDVGGSRGEVVRGVADHRELAVGVKDPDPEREPLAGGEVVADAAGEVLVGDGDVAVAVELVPAQARQSSGRLVQEEAARVPPLAVVLPGGLPETADLRWQKFSRA